MSATPNLTDKELAVLKSIANNNYGDQGDMIWAWAVNDSRTPSGITGHALSGVLSSLHKKQLISTFEYEKNEDVICMQPLGKLVVDALGLVEA